MPKGKVRSTYCLRNALNFKKYFDEIIKDPTSTKFLSLKTIGGNPKTCQQKLSDALLYLAREYDAAHNDGLIPPSLQTSNRQKDYIFLKGMCRFKFTEVPELGINASTAYSNIQNLGNQIVKDLISHRVEEHQGVDWKSRVIEFLSSPVTGTPQILNMDDLVLKPEDVEWLRRMFLSADCEFKVEGTHGFRAVK